MITLGDIFRRYGPQYGARYGHHMSADQHAAMRAIEQCWTEALGGHVYTCPSCQTTRYSHHSCRNRHCPTCQQEATQEWLAAQHALLLPVPYFLMTFTLPAKLRAIARQQRHITRQPNGYRSFTPAAIDRLQHLKHARTQGYTVAKLRHLTTSYDAGKLDAPERRAFLKDKIARISRQIASLETMRSTFERELDQLS